jgi:hypothetical protein
MTDLINAGFCSSCGLIREDFNGTQLTDCACSARRRHADGCTYVKAVRMPVSVGSCEPHGLDACDECDCDCGSVLKTSQPPSTGEGEK